MHHGRYAAAYLGIGLGSYGGDGRTRRAEDGEPASQPGPRLCLGVAGRDPVDARHRADRRAAGRAVDGCARVRPVCACLRQQPVRRGDGGPGRCTGGRGGANGSAADSRSWPRSWRPHSRCRSRRTRRREQAASTASRARMPPACRGTPRSGTTATRGRSRRSSFALGTFEALVGFRPLDRTVALLDALAAAQLSGSSPTRCGTASCARCSLDVMSTDRDSTRVAVAALGEACHAYAGTEFAAEAATLDAACPGLPGRPGRARLDAAEPGHPVAVRRRLPAGRERARVPARHRLRGDGELGQRAARRADAQARRRTGAGVGGRLHAAAGPGAAGRRDGRARPVGRTGPGVRTSTCTGRIWTAARCRPVPVGRGSSHASTGP